MALLPQDPKAQKQLLLGILPILLAFAYYQFYHTKRAEEVVTLESHVERLDAINSSMRAVIARYGNLPERLAIYEAHIGQLEQLIPRREDVPVLISLITARAQQIGVELAGLNPSAEQTGAFYSQQAYDIQVLGDYHRLGEYLTAIGSLPRIVRSTGVTLRVDQVATEPGESPRLRASFRIETFIAPEQDTAPISSTGGLANANG